MSNAKRVQAYYDSLKTSQSEELYTEFVFLIQEVKDTHEVRMWASQGPFMPKSETYEIFHPDPNKGLRVRKNKGQYSVIYTDKKGQRSVTLSGMQAQKVYEEWLALGYSKVVNEPEITQEEASRLTEERIREGNEPVEKLNEFMETHGVTGYEPGSLLPIFKGETKGRFF